MLDINLIRNQTEAVREALGRKKFAFDLDRFLQLDQQRRAAVLAAETARANQKAANAEMAALDKKSGAFQEKVAAMREFAARVKELEAGVTAVEVGWQQALEELPNLPAPEAPVGRGEADNREVRRSDFDPEGFAKALPHYDLPGFVEQLDFARGVKVAGAGFPFYLGETARLVRHLLGFFLDEAVARGYREVHCPVVVNEASARATGQLPDKEGQMYSTREDALYLIPTAEVPVTNFFRDEIFEEAALPAKACAYTPCFRREAGSWGKDVRGLNRLHQFDKVELVRWELPEASAAAHLELLGDAEALLQILGLPYRVLEICTGDMGFPHARQFDLEVWAAGQKRWLEVSSCSNFTDFQARRANIRYRDPEGKPRFVHTLNGSGLAVPRVLAALLENGFDGETAVVLPPVLAGRMGTDRLLLKEG